MGGNNLFGTILLSLYNMTSMCGFLLDQNQFKGTLPPQIGLTLPNIQAFAISGNEFSGMILASFSSSSQLQLLDFLDN